MSTFDARVIGAGRAGGSLARALAGVGWVVDGPWTRNDATPERLAAAGVGTRLLVLAVGDAAIASVAAAIEPSDAVVVHLAGARGLDVLHPHERVGSIHPLVALPDATLGALRLAGAWYAHAGDPAAREIAAALGGRIVAVADADRTRYHAAAVVAANHLVALLGQVERLAESVGVPFDAYLDLARGALESAAALGPAAALTGPVARGDWATVAGHLSALAPDERPAYALLADQARRLAARAEAAA